MVSQSLKFTDSRYKTEVCMTVTEGLGLKVKKIKLEISLDDRTAVRVREAPTRCTHVCSHFFYFGSRF